MGPETTETTLVGVSLPVLTVGVVAGAHIGALLVFSALPSAAVVAAFEGGVLALVGLLTVFSDGLGRTVIALCLAYSLSTALTVAALLWGSSLTGTTVGLVVTLFLVGYGVHRYELVALDLVEPTDE